MSRNEPQTAAPTLTPPERRGTTASSQGLAPRRQSENRRIPELDGLRGLAITLVLCLHFIGNSHGGQFGTFLYRFQQAFRLGWSGVDLFFVLSGFLIGGILLEARGSENYYRTFYARRVYRIFPIYHLWLLLYALIKLADPHVALNSVAGTAAELRHLPFYFAFLQNFVSPPFQSFDWYWLVATWSLAVEEQFYLVAPFLVRRLSQRSLTIALSATVVLAPILRELVYRFAPGTGFWYVLMPCRADSLAVGILAAMAWRDEGVRAALKARTQLIYGALFFLFCGLPVLVKFFPNPLSHLTGTLGLSWLAFFYAALLMTVLVDPAGSLARAMRWKWLIRMGALSYCLYLIHLPINGILHAALLHSGPSIASASGVAVTLLAFAVAFGLASLSGKYLEGPMIRRGHALSYSSGRALRARSSAAEPVSVVAAAGDAAQG